MSWKKSNLLRWAAELRRHPVAGVALCAAGMLFTVLTSFLDRTDSHQSSPLNRALTFENNHSVAFSLVGIAFFIWLLGDNRPPRQKGAVLILSFFAGAMIGRCVHTVATQLASSSLW
jgi:zinc transporter ZupT